MKRAAGAALVVLALMVPAVGMAADSPEESATVNVRYHDLDLSKTTDAAILLHRIDNAAMEACGASPFSFSEYRQAVRHSDCFQDSVSRAVAAVNAPNVSALYDSRKLALAREN